MSSRVAYHYAGLNVMSITPRIYNQQKRIGELV